MHMVSDGYAVSGEEYGDLYIGRTPRLSNRCLVAGLYGDLAIRNVQNLYTLPVYVANRPIPNHG